MFYIFFFSKYQTLPLPDLNDLEMSYYLLSDHT